MGIDTAGDDASPGNVITPELGACLFRDGYRWVARYTRPDGVVLDSPKPGGDWQGCYSLSIAETRWILDAGLGIVPVQFGVFGDVARGNAVGRAMAQTHRLLGFPGGAHHFLDVEGRGPASAGPAACREYIEAAAATALAGGESAPRVGLYRTGQVPLTARETYRLRGITAYWAAAGPVPPSPAPRCDAIQQRPPGEVCGIACDRDYMRPDNMGACPSIVVTPEIAARLAGEAMADLISAQPIV
jgi:hypothetical protein